MTFVLKHSFPCFSIKRKKPVPVGFLRMVLSAAVAMTSSVAFAQLSSSDNDIPNRGVAPTQPDRLLSASVPAFVEYEKKLLYGEQVNPLSSDLFGDVVSPYLGQTDFSVVDIDLPGNSPLPVQLRRRFAISMLTKEALRDPRGGVGNPYGGIGNWDVEVPYIYGTFDLNKKWHSTEPGYVGRCSTPDVARGDPGYTSLEIWSGNKVHIPGQGELGMMRVDPTWPPLNIRQVGQGWTTSRFDAFACIPSTNGEGFKMTTTDGITYTFDVYLERWYPAVVHSQGPGGANARLMIFLLASKVEDRHGNKVEYSYDGAGHPWKISSNDNREIILKYNPSDASLLDRAEVTLSTPAETRVWKYGYQNSPRDGLPQLTSVTLPNNTQWTYTYSNTDYLYVGYDQDDTPGLECNPLWFNSGGDFKLGITHPYGSQATFEFDLLRHKRNLPSSGANCAQGQYIHPPYIDTFSLTAKTISESNNTSSTWRYSYNDNFCQGAGCNTAVNRVTQPDGSVIESKYSTMYEATGPFVPAGSAIAGQLLGVEYKPALGQPSLRSEIYQYVTGIDVDRQPFTGYPFPSRYGETWGSDDAASGSVRPLKSLTITQDGVTFTRTNETFDAVARPLKVTLSSKDTVSGTLRDSRTETTAYEDNKPLWVMGQIKSVTEGPTGSGPQMVLNAYDSATANLLNVREFGVLKRSMTYKPSNGTPTAGTLSTINDGRYTTTLGTFKRGIPQSVSYPDGTSVSAEIDDAGNIRSTTNELNSTTEYGYDVLNRLTSITYPDGDNDGSNWNSTSIAYQMVDSSPEVGLSWKHLRRTRTTDQAVQVTHYDHRLRPIRTWEYDNNNQTETKRYTARSYDFANRELFASYPSKTLNPTNGITTTYDVLGRVRTTTQASELGALLTKTDYVTPFTKVVTDPSNNRVQTTFQAFDAPGEDAPKTIIESVSSTENVTTTIARDVFGKPLSVQRQGTYSGANVSQTRTYVYDPGQRLCKTIEPESGATVQDYDAAGNVVWDARGLTLPSTTDCSRTSVTAADKTTYRYDERNRLADSTFPSGTSPINRTYRDDGVLKTIQSNGAKWTYDYNQRKLLTSESLEYDGQTFLLDWSYDGNGSVKQLMYPDNSLIDFAPNALGQPTQAGTLATGVKYFPNGAMSEFTYGNGIVHTLTSNLRQLPAQSKDVKPAAPAVTNLTYTYDKSANVESIVDGLPSATESRVMTYDGLDRLKTANATGMWGAASFDYDPLDNLRVSKVGIRNCTHAIDAITNRLNSISGPNCSTKNYGYNTRGSMTSSGTQEFVFDRAERLIAATGKETYEYDGLGRRVGITRLPGTNKEYQVYSKEGQLLFSWNAATNKQITYAYLNGSLVARQENVPAPRVPINLGASPNPSTSGNFTISWSSSAGATKYLVTERNTDDSVSTFDVGTSTNWSPSSPRAVGRYTYRVQACNQECSDFSDPITEWVRLRTPTGLSASPNPSFTGEFVLTWNGVPDADGYEVEGKESTGTNWTRVCRDTTNSCAMTVAVGGTYSYRVRATHPTGASDYSTSVAVTVTAVDVVTVEPSIPTWAVDGNYTVSWTPVAGVTSYKLETNVPGGWHVISTQPGTNWIKTDDRDYGRKEFRVSACTTPTVCTPPRYSRTVVVPELPFPPASLAISSWSGGGVTGGRLTLTWPAVADARAYEVQELSADGEWHALAMVQSGVSYVVTRDKGTYSYRVRACGGTLFLWPGKACRNLYSPTRTVTVTQLGSSRTPEIVTTYVHTDGLRSPIVETDKDGGVTARFLYEPYGAPTNATYFQGPGYGGHVMDTATQLVYMQQRYYDPIAGRFLSTDPMAANPGSFNRYWYANNNPYKNIDPDGRQSSLKDHPSLRDGVRTYNFNVPLQHSDKLPQKMLESAYRDLEGKGKDGKERGTVGYLDDGVYSSKEMPSVSRGEIPWTFTKGDPTVSYLSHTHGDAVEWYEDYFSRDDTAAAKQYALPVFLWTRHDEFKVYTSDMKTGGKVPGGRKLAPDQAVGITLCKSPCN